MADIHRLYPRQRAGTNNVDLNQKARDLLTERLTDMRRVVFDDLGISKDHLGVRAFMDALCKPEVTDFHIANHVLFGGPDEWQGAPEFYAALVLAHEKRAEIAAFFLPEQFTT